MNDIVERLRGNASELQTGSPLHDTGECRLVMNEAADEIERLRRNIRIEQKLNEIIERIKKLGI